MRFVRSRVCDGGDCGALVMAVTVQNIVVFCDVTPCSFVGLVRTFSAVPVYGFEES
jgi:hypothetical protein